MFISLATCYIRIIVLCNIAPICVHVDTIIALVLQQSCITEVIV